MTMPNNVPSNLMVVGFNDDQTAGKLLIAIQQSDASGALRLGNIAVLTRDAANHVTAVKQPSAHEEMREAIRYGTTDIKPLGIVELLAGEAMKQAVPLDLSDDLIHTVAGWMPPNASALLAVILIERGADVVQVLAGFSQGRLLMHTMPPDVAAHVAPLFQG